MSLSQIITYQRYRAGLSTNNINKYYEPISMTDLAQLEELKLELSKDLDE